MIETFTECAITGFPVVVGVCILPITLPLFVIGWYARKLKCRR